MEILTSCNDAPIDLYIPSGENPWDINKIRHLYRRLGFSALEGVIEGNLNGTPEVLIDALIDEARDMPNSPAPNWAFWSFEDFPEYNDTNQDYIQTWYRQAVMDLKNKGLKARLSFFWLNHFVAQIETFNHSPYLFQYWDTLQTHSLGNFKTFVREIGLQPAMLLMLNGFENTSQNPNENYARELYELFTLGENNGYTQNDIEETSRALTGYNHWNDYGGAITYNESTFDSTEKTIFGQTGNWGYDDVINILFAEKGDLISQFICSKLYAYFVSPDVSDEIISSMATTLMANNWEMEPVLRQLFKSEHFFDEAAQHQLIKSPYDLMLTFWNRIAFNYEGSEYDFLGFIMYVTGMLGQDLFQPIDVAGWQRDQDWINSSTLTGRWLGMEYMSWNFWNGGNDQYKDFARNLVAESTDPVVITKTIVDHFISRPLYTESDYAIAESIFKWEIPENYWTDGIWNWNFDSAAYQTILLIQHIFRMPEFQLK